jgi:hypothetical protein
MVSEQNQKEKAEIEKSKQKEKSPWSVKGLAKRTMKICHAETFSRANRPM